MLPQEQTGEMPEIRCIEWFESPRLCSTHRVHSRPNKNFFGLKGFCELIMEDIRLRILSKPLLQSSVSSFTDVCTEMKSSNCLVLPCVCMRAHARVCVWCIYGGGITVAPYSENGL